MAITQLSKQVTKETETVAIDATSITVAHHNNGYLAKLGGTAPANSAQSPAQLGGAIDDATLGVIQNVSRANITSSSVPPLATDGTAPGSDTAVVGTRGNFVVRFTSAPTLLDPVVPDAAGKAVTKNNPDPGDTVIGHCIQVGSTIDSTTDVWGVVRVRL